MKPTKQINLRFLSVELYDIRCSKPHMLTDDSIVVDRGRIIALRHLGQSIIAGLYEARD